MSISDFSIARAIIKERVALNKNKSVEELIPGVDYDPISIDERAYKMVQESRGIYSNWTGD